MTNVQFEIGEIVRCKFGNIPHQIQCPLVEGGLYRIREKYVTPDGSILYTVSLPDGDDIISASHNRKFSVFGFWFERAKNDSTSSKQERIDTIFSYIDALKHTYLAHDCSKEDKNIISNELKNQIRTLLNIYIKEN